MLPACNTTTTEDQGVIKISDSSKPSSTSRKKAPRTYLEKYPFKKYYKTAVIASSNSKNTATKPPQAQGSIKKPNSKPVPPMIFGDKTKTPKKVPPTKNGLATGTGFFISYDGHLLTNEHVVAQARELMVFVGDTAHKARIVSLNEQDDIAILKINLKTKPLAIKSSEPFAGTGITVLGFPNIGIQGNEIKSTFGYVNAASGLKGDQRYFQFSAEIQPGNSGSPVIDEQGYVIGVATSTLNQQVVVAQTGALAQGVNYALKARHAENLIEKSGVFIPAYIASVGAENRVELVQYVKESVVLIVAAIGKNAEIPKTKPRVSGKNTDKQPELNSIGREEQSAPRVSASGTKHKGDPMMPINNRNHRKQAEEIPQPKESHYNYIHFDR